MNDVNSTCSVNTVKGYSFEAMLVLVSIAICSFGIGTTEFLPAGLLPNIASTFNISIPIAADAVSFYAFGVGIAGPLLTAGTINWTRKYVLAGLMVVFIVGNIISAVSPTFDVLMFSRILTSLCHG
jgi:MFS transporter, DHA1 family, inner membrane transport protein